MDYYKSLRLGRGINVTDLHMWRNKSAFIVREINGDIIETEECGMFEKYEKIVSTISREQQKIRLSLNDPSSQIKIGMDAEQTQSVTSNIRIAGTKVKTRTISFCTTLDDLPPYVQHLDKPQHIYKPNQEKNSFERTFCSWILNQIRNDKNDDRKESEVESELPTAKAIQEIFDYAANEEKRKKIHTFCEAFVRDLGITHYVNSIELGAMKYNAATISSREEKLGGGAEVGAGKYAQGGLSRFTEKLKFQSHKEETSIGKIVEGVVVKENEAVIGFQIQPIYSLTPIPYLQPALTRAVKEYIQRKEDPIGEIFYSAMRT